MRRLFVALLWAVPVWAQNPTNPKLDGIFPDRPTNHLTDVAGVVKNPAELNTALRGIQVRDTLQLAAVTLPTTRGYPVEDVAREIGRRWRVAQTDSIGAVLRNTGGVILIVMDSRDCRVEVARGSEGYMTDARAADACRSAAQYFRSGDFGGGILSIATTFAERHRQELERARVAALPPVPPKPFNWGFFWLGFGLIGLSAVVLVLLWRRHAEQDRQLRAEREERERQAWALEREQDRRRQQEAREREIARAKREAERWAALTPEEQAAELAERERQRAIAAERRRKEEADAAERRRRQEEEERNRPSYTPSYAPPKYDGGSSGGGGGFGGFGGSGSFGGGGGGSKW